jgi:inhibitor of cysteine peptidase
MKKAIVLGLIFILLLPLLALGCKSEEPAVTIELSCDDFAAQNHITRDVELSRPGSLIVNLCSNPTTGFSWGETAEISAPSVIEQESHSFVEPQAGGDVPIVGAPGKDVWVFNALKAGTATISMSYSRPWEGGEKDAWTLVLNVTVK